MKNLFVMVIIGFFSSTGNAEKTVAPVASQTKINSGFEKLKTLIGEWQTPKDKEGKTMEVSYQLVSGGSAIVETIKKEKEAAMVTVFHADGENLMMTHYCSVGNQPRMRAKTAQGDVKMLDFEYIDATNLVKPTDGHMHKLTISFKDRDHVTNVWTMRSEGKDMPHTFNLERKN